MFSMAKEEVIEMRPQGYSPGPILRLFEYEETFNDWTKLQRKEIKLRYTLLEIAYLILAYGIELMALGFLFVPTEGQKDHAYTMALHFLLTSVTILVYLWLRTERKGWQLPPTLTKDDLLNFLKKVLFLFKPFKQIRTLLYYRNQKASILANEFIPDDTATKDRIDAVVKINEKEVFEARFNLYESFLLGIFMSLFQCLYLLEWNASTESCSKKDTWRALLICMHIISAAKCSVSYEWKKRLYLNSLHVQTFVATLARYPVPETDFKPLSFILLFISHLSSICLRFYAISYASGIHAGIGFAHFILLCQSHCLLTRMSRNIYQHVENVPEGVTIPLCRFLDIIVNAFTVKETRCNENSSRKVLCPKFTMKLPLICTQLFTFGLPHAIIVGFVVTYGFQFPKLNDHQPSNVFNCTSINEPEWEFSFLQTFRETLSSFLGKYKLKPNSAKEFTQGLDLFWICILAYIGSTLLYNIYSRVCTKVKRTHYYPVNLSCEYLKRIFAKVEEDAAARGADPSRLFKRLLFVISLSRSSFRKILNSFHKLSHAKRNTEKWWEERITEELVSNSAKSETQPLNRYQYQYQRTGLAGNPLETKLEGIKSDVFRDDSTELYNYCITNIDQVLVNEMTSDRIVATLKLFGMNPNEAYQQIQDQARSSP